MTPTPRPRPPARPVDDDGVPPGDAGLGRESLTPIWDQLADRWAKLTVDEPKRGTS